MSAIGPRRERGGLCARCLPSLPAPCFGDTALGLGDGDQRIMWVLIQPATRIDVTCWLPQVTLWRKKIKSRCLVKGITKQEATSCCREYLFFVSTALWLPLQRYLDFPFKNVPLFCSLLFSLHVGRTDHTPYSRVSSDWLSPSSISYLPKNRIKRKILRTCRD